MSLIFSGMLVFLRSGLEEESSATKICHDFEMGTTFILELSEGTTPMIK